MYQMAENQPRSSVRVLSKTVPVVTVDAHLYERQIQRLRVDCLAPEAPHLRQMNLSAHLNFSK